MEAKETYTRELLRRWLSGEINAREEAELLAAAEHDVFLREALGGYQALPEEDHRAALIRLREGARTAKRPMRPPIRWLAVAASILLLLTAAWWALDRQRELDTNSVAMEVEAEPQQEMSEDATSTIPAPATIEAAPNNDRTPIAQAEPPAALRPPDLPAVAPTRSTDKRLAEEKANAMMAARSAQERRRQKEDVPTIASPTIPNIYSAPKDAEVVVLEAEESQSDELSIEPQPASPFPPVPTTTPAQDQGYLARKRSYISNSGVPVPAPGFRMVEGYVRDSEGYPLIGASILVQGTGNGTVTDLDGFFTLSVKEESTNLVVSYTGFDTAEITLAAAEKEVEIALEESRVALDEVVVTGYGATPPSTADETMMTARPQGGFRALRQHIEENTPANTPRARIKVSFLVQSDGSLQDFSVLRTTNVGQNDLAINLLKTGPSWEVTNGNAPVEVVYVVKFR